MTLVSYRHWTRQKSVMDSEIRKKLRSQLMGSTSVTQLQQPKCNDTVATTETGGNIEGQTRQKFS